LGLACILHQYDDRLTISGNQLGEISLQAVSIVFPLFSVIYFFSYLVAPGSSILFGKHIGEFEQEKAYRAAGTGMLSSVIIGIILAIGLWLIKDTFLSCFGCTGELLKEASAYYNWLIPFVLIESFERPVYYLALTDGESDFLSLSCVSEILVNVVLSITLSRSFGIAGLGIATCTGHLICTLSNCLHFLRKSNSVKLHLCLDFAIIRRSVVLSFSRCMSYIFLAIVDLLMNKIIIASCGMEYISVYSVVNLVFGVCEVFGSLNDAGVGMLTCFLGEKNKHGITLLLRKTACSMLIMASVVFAFFFFGADLIPVIYGLDIGATARAAVFASKVMAFTALGFGTNYLCAEISCSLEKPVQSFLINVLYDVFSPLVLSLLFGLLWGFSGIVIGLSLSTYFAFAIYALIIVKKKGKYGFPIYVEDFGEEGCSFDIRVSLESVTKMRDAVSKELTAHGYEIKNVDLLLEEFFTRVMEKNPNKAVLAECSLLFGADRMRIIIRDDGTLFNFVDENNIVESLNAHVLNSLLEQTKQKNYLMTVSFNRNGFVFEKQSSN